ncbi:hypothetical protein [Jeotgalibacillus campisalis]|uniref:Uncharacterized protein n=1 Tax=Jeotgalibacillus campisalis TaxID=220754 RepID=A0A0C2WA40_9BACL|nr:hypothetical protein [Jeotgalibacillus campisalis]KIL52918.1 hypothetical protein KR50_02470 [Jeotgalibacillus campisalis]
MKKWLISLTFASVVLAGVFVLYFYFNPPLSTGGIGASDNNKSIILSVGNESFGTIKVDEILVNKKESPSEVKMQVTNPYKGFVITEDFSEYEEEYGMTDLALVEIEPYTSPSSQYANMDNGTATTDDISYGLSVIHKDEIKIVTIKYKYFGIPLEEVIHTNLHTAFSMQH